MFQILDQGFRVFLKATNNVIWIKASLLLRVQRSLGENLDSDLQKEQRFSFPHLSFGHLTVLVGLNHHAGYADDK